MYGVVEIEKQERFDKPVITGRVRVNLCVPYELVQVARMRGIKLGYALCIGIRHIVGGPESSGIETYKVKMDRMSRLLEALCQENGYLKERVQHLERMQH